jgi:hypothetical protein
MGEFTGAVLGFPTVLFGGALVVVVGFWAVVLVGAADAHGPGHHGFHDAPGHGGGHAGGHGGSHAGVHVSAHGGGHAGAHGNAHGGAPASGHGRAHAGHGSVRAGHGGRQDASGGRRGGGFLAAAGLEGVPVTVVFSLLIALGWFLSPAGSAALDGAGLRGGPARAAAGCGVLVGALIGSWSLTWVLVRPLRRLFPQERAPSREDFVGMLCVIRTGTVTGRFGQAEVAAPDGSTSVVQVRRHGDEVLTAGRTALLYAYEPDGEFFWVAPFTLASGPDTAAVT